MRNIYFYSSYGGDDIISIIFVCAKLMRFFYETFIEQILKLQKYFKESFFKNIHTRVVKANQGRAIINHSL